MRGDEARIVLLFADWLRSEGWNVELEVNHVDVVARRGSVTLLAEAKGLTSSPGTDLDTLYGQLLRRAPEHDPSVLLGVVVPDSLRTAALRVPGWMRSKLSITVFVVGDHGVETI